MVLEREEVTVGLIMLSNSKIRDIAKHQKAKLYKDWVILRNYHLLLRILWCKTLRLLIRPNTIRNWSRLMKQCNMLRHLQLLLKDLELDKVTKGETLKVKQDKESITRIKINSSRLILNRFSSDLKLLKTQVLLPQVENNQEAIAVQTIMDR